MKFEFLKPNAPSQAHLQGTQCRHTKANLTKESALFPRFSDTIPKHANGDFQYEVYVQLLGGLTKIWRPVKAKMISEDTLQISDMPALNYSDIRTLSLDDLTFEKEDIFKYKTNVSLDIK